MTKFKAGDRIVMHKVRAPRFKHLGWVGKVVEVLGIENGEQIYAVEMWTYGVNYPGCVRESDIVPMEEWKNHPMSHWKSEAIKSRINELRPLVQNDKLIQQYIDQIESRLNAEWDERYATIGLLPYLESPISDVDFDDLEKLSKLVNKK